VVLVLAAIFGLPALTRGAGRMPEVTATTTSLAPLATFTPAPVTETPAPTLATTEEAVATAAAPPTPAPEIADDKGAEMVLVPGGSFTMGSEAGGPDERPIHVIGMDPFYIDKYEVTNAQYKECVNALVCDLPDPTRLYTDARLKDHPVVYVDWEMASAYCAWREARLPTEAEWEKAARGTELFSYPWGNDFDGKLLNYCDLNCTESGADRAFNDGFDTTAPVGSYAGGVSPYGVFDMAGNVTEWLADWYGADYYASSPRQNPAGPESGAFRVLRGGSWLDKRDDTRIFMRAFINPVTATKYIGFRCVRDVNP
jgi:formylglycine-generating enzyme required for sulfatase activity